MTDKSNHQNGEISDGDRPVASADVTMSTGSEGIAHINLGAESGHLPSGSRTRLIDAVLELSDGQDCAQLQATVPRGDAE